MGATSLLTVLLFCSAATVSTNPVILNTSPVAIPLTKRLDLTSLQGGHLLKHDQARAQALQAKAGGTSVTSSSVQLSSAAVVGNEPVNNTGAVTYIAAIGVGNPPTTCACYKDYTDAVGLIIIFR